MKSITIEGQIRTATGKGAAKVLRSEEKVPAVIYGGAKEINLSVSAKSLRPLVYTGEFILADVVVDGATYKCIVKDLQFHKVSDELIHVDFLELVDTKPVIATIPIKYVGAPVGVKVGGKLIIKVKALKVKCLPKYLAENIIVDIAALELNASIRVEAVKMEGVEVMNSPRIPMASIVMTRQLKQEETAEKGKK
jgi:large subunit ribosomal protein L25